LEGGLEVRYELLQRVLCAKCNVDALELARHNETVFVPYLHQLLTGPGHKFLYMINVALVAEGAPPSASTLLDVAARARAAEGRPWTLPAVQGLLAEATINVRELDRTYEFRLRRGSGDFDGRTLLNDRHRGSGTAPRQQR
jgi:hypothetical protein